MVCLRCGNPVEGAFCSRCGAPAQAVPPHGTPYGLPPQPPYQAPAPPYGAPMPPYGMMPAPRVQQNLQTLSILWFVYGAYRIAAGIFGAMFLMGMAHSSFFQNMGMRGFPFDHAFMGTIGLLVAVYTFFSAAVSFTVGYSLMHRKPWGRVLAMVMGILALIRIPLGTALGIYTLWVLAPSASAAEYEAIADRS